MMKKANLKIWIILALIVALITMLIFYLGYEKPQPTSNYFTPEPKTWIEANDNPNNPGDIQVNIFKGTRGNSIYNVNQQDYNIVGETLSLFTKGYYNGIPFNRVYIDPQFYNITANSRDTERLDLVSNYSKIQISPNLNPNDGIIDAFIMLRLEKEEPGIYIFVDEDWKDHLEFTNIVWGDDFNNLNTLKTQKFDFNDPTDGIYINKIDQGLAWMLQSPVRGGLVIGEINLKVMEDLINQRDINNTIVYVR